MQEEFTETWCLQTYFNSYNAAYTHNIICLPVCMFWLSFLHVGLIGTTAIMLKGKLCHYFTWCLKSSIISSPALDFIITFHCIKLLLNIFTPNICIQFSEDVFSIMAPKMKCFTPPLISSLFLYCTHKVCIPADMNVYKAAMVYVIKEKQTKTHTSNLQRSCVRIVNNGSDIVNKHYH